MIVLTIAGHLQTRHAGPTRHAGEGRHPRLAFVPQANSWIPAFAGMAGNGV
jgi:hypothetical protein